jgi:hypothetical protein
MNDDDVDLLTPAQDAVFAALAPLEALAGTDGLPDGLGVYQHVPQGTRPPMVVIGNVTTTNKTDNEDEQDEEVRVEVHCMYAGEGRVPLLKMQAAVKRVLKGKQLPAQPGVWFETPRFLTSEATTAWENDGITYVGLSIFEFRAAPA